MKKIVILILIGLLLFGGLFSTGFINIFNDKNTLSTNTTNEIDEPIFKKEGVLTFLKTNKKLTIEIADNDAERQQGLMYRKTMPDSCGMLFIMPTNELQSFWMKNTYLPLDILYLNESKKIVTIQANRIPFSEDPINSFENARYVLEVNAGYSQRHGIKKGDVLNW